MLHSIRQVEPLDQPILWDILYEAHWDPPVGPRRPRSVLSNPAVVVYVTDWGSKDTDLGFLAISSDGLIAGGILSRILLPPVEGGAFYDTHTPQFIIALFPAFRKQGIGTRLLAEYLTIASARFARVSLAVHPANHVAINLYARFGFYQFGFGHDGFLKMVKALNTRAEQRAAPNGGPDTPIGNSGVTEGPPSVS